MCFEVIEALQQCHASNPVLKYFGTCNDARKKMDECFTEEYLAFKQKSWEKAEAQKKLHQEYLLNIKENNGVK